MDREQIVGEIARRHGVVLRKEDPLFATVTLNELVLGEYIRQANASLAKVHETFIKACGHELEHSKRGGAEAIKEAGRYAAGHVRKAGEAVRGELELAMRTQIEALVAKAAAVRRHRLHAFWCAVVSVGAAVVVVVSVLVGIAGH